MPPEKTLRYYAHIKHEEAVEFAMGNSESYYIKSKEANSKEPSIKEIQIITKKEKHAIYFNKKIAEKIEEYQKKKSEYHENSRAFIAGVFAKILEDKNETNEKKKYVDNLAKTFLDDNINDNALLNEITKLYKSDKLSKEDNKELIKYRNLFYTFIHRIELYNKAKSKSLEKNDFRNESELIVVGHGSPGSETLSHKKEGKLFSDEFSVKDISKTLGKYKEKIQLEKVELLACYGGVTKAPQKRLETDKAGMPSVTKHKFWFDEKPTAQHLANQLYTQGFKQVKVLGIQCQGKMQAEYMQRLPRYEIGGFSDTDKKKVSRYFSPDSDTKK
ncbi:hypothetical protein N480_06580 [Pseudoalteromonas luteoviolacea S2607]|uniref:hypothetical protein n=1 Tax=Pseudoalteromonas luteoviolacea TaxID=43657 RepID=UPI0007B0A18F|nr:hypothetical protein [Pseudoalteromonas luteoviolacea]KZN30622.1 hypothetical protein N480_06580 [Pseudoalteromonas luteoviolacea S2607]